MTIRKGEAWGEPWRGDDDVVTAADDRELALMAHRMHRGEERSLLSVRSGDLLATIGLDEPRPIDQRWRFSVDLGLLAAGRPDEDDDRGEAPVEPFVAHLVARRALWRGSAAVVMNTPLLGPYRLGPKAHPNDGLLDVTVGSLDWRQRFEAARRARTGTHLPHPDLRTVRRPEWEHNFDRPTPIELDGHRVGSRRMVRVSIVPDAFELVI